MKKAPPGQRPSGAFCRPRTPCGGPRRSGTGLGLPEYHAFKLKSSPGLQFPDCSPGRKSGTGARAQRAGGPRQGREKRDPERGEAPTGLGLPGAPSGGGGTGGRRGEPHETCSKPRRCERSQRRAPHRRGTERQRSRKKAQGQGAAEPEPPQPPPQAGRRRTAREPKGPGAGGQNKPAEGGRRPPGRSQPPPKPRSGRAREDPAGNPRRARREAETQQGRPIREPAAQRGRPGSEAGPASARGARQRAQGPSAGAGGPGPGGGPGGAQRRAQSAGPGPRSGGGRARRNGPAHRNGAQQGPWSAQRGPGPQARTSEHTACGDVAQRRSRAGRVGPRMGDPGPGPHARPRLAPQPDQKGFALVYRAKMTERSGAFSRGARLRGALARLLLDTRTLFRQVRSSYG